MFAQTPPPPYYAAIFTSRRRPGDTGYAEAAAELVALAGQAEGFLGAESVRDEQGRGITVSYWASLEAIRAFRDQPSHVAARRNMSAWYEDWTLRVCLVEREAAAPHGRPVAERPGAG